jgi:hypothetical protein
MFEANQIVAERGPERRKLHGQSRITNGKALLPGVDGRSPWVRRCKDVIAAHIADLGGSDNCSEAERSIIRRAAVLTTELERMEAVFAVAGEASPEQLDIYARVAANMRRMLESIGLQRRARTIGPTLGELIKQDQQARQFDKQHADLDLSTVDKSQANGNGAA